MCDGNDGARKPERPLLPLSLWALLAALACTRGSLSANVDPVPLLVAALATGVLGAALSALVARTRRRAAAALVLGVSAAVACSFVSSALELAGQRALSDALSSSSVSRWELRLEGDMGAGASGWRGRATVLGGAGELGSVWVTADEPLSMGETVRCVGRFSANEDGEWGRASRAQGLAGTVRVVRLLEQREATGAHGAVLGAREMVLQALDPASSDARALLAGSVCGSTTAMAERGLDDLFAACGVSHLVAVSGGHLVLVAALVSCMLERARVKPAVRAALLLAATLAFVVFCGAPSSAVRAWAMSLVAELSRLTGRRSHPLSAASLVALVMALVDPGVTGQLGYLLSVLCVCGICALAPYARYAVRAVAGRGPRWRGPLAARVRRAWADGSEALALTLVSQLVTAPLTCSTFSQLSLVAPLANVVLAPLFSALLACGLVAALLSWAPPACAIALVGCDAVGSLVIWLLRLLSRLPLACMAVSVDEGAALLALVAALGALLVWWPSVSRRALLAVLGCACALAVGWVLRWRLFAPPCVRVLDVGQGDAILVTDGAAAVLVDTGPGDAVVEALARSNVYHLDAVVVTHLHDDHAGGLEGLRATVGFDRLLVAEGTDADELGPAAEELGYGDVLRVGRFELEAISPVAEVDGWDNEDSLVLALSFDDGERTLTALLTGDAEQDVMAEVLARGDAGDVDLLKVGHHGSAASIDEEQARALAPELSVASAGEGNAYGHPDPACVGALEGAGSLVLCTKDVGDVCVEPGADGPRVSCSRGELP